MARVKKSESSENTRRRRPAISPEARQNQLIGYAIDLVEQRLIDGTASSQETTHFLKLATLETKLKNENLELQKELTKAKTKSIQSEEKKEAMFKEAIQAFKAYSGQSTSDDDEDDED